MSAFDTLFYLTSALVLVSAAFSVLHPNILYAGLSLFGAFFGVAIYYVMLGADFVAATQVLIYVGGILTLLLFAVMLSKNIYNASFQDEKRRKVIPAIISTVVFVFLIKLIVTVDWNTVSGGDSPLPTTRKLGALLLTDYLLPFELASILLLAALVGAIYLARSQK